MKLCIIPPNFSPIAVISKKLEPCRRPLDLAEAYHWKFRSFMERTKIGQVWPL